MRILITGGSGFIGTNLISSLISDGHIVSNIDNRVPRNPNYSSTWSKIDIRDKISLRKNIFQFKPEFLIHLAARTDLDGTSIDDYDSNTLGIQNIVDVCLTCPSIERIIFSSTRLVCKIGYLPSSDNDYNPSTIYGESKVLGEKVIKTSARKARWTWCIVRLTQFGGRGLIFHTEHFLIPDLWKIHTSKGSKNCKEFLICWQHYFSIRQTIKSP